jgi:hypothetical protein
LFFRGGVFGAQGWFASKTYHVHVHEARARKARSQERVGNFVNQRFIYGEAETVPR